MKRLAKQLALAFDKAEWFEDDEDLCAWVIKQCGQKLTLEQAACLRHHLEIQIDKFPMVAIFVQGGVVRCCKSNDPTLRVHVVDRDAIAREKDPIRAEKLALFVVDECVYDVLP